MAFYTPLLSNSGTTLVMMKATSSPTVDGNWSNKDGSVFVSASSTVSMWAVEHDSDIYVLTMSGMSTVKLHIFDPGTDTWTTKNEMVAKRDSNLYNKPVPGEEDQAGCSLAIRSDGDIIAVISTEGTLSGVPRIYHRIRTGSTWGSLLITISGNGGRHPIAIGPAADDRITIIWVNKDFTRIITRSINSSDTLGTLVQVDTGGTASQSPHRGVIDSADEIYIIRTSITDQIIAFNWTSAADPTGDITNLGLINDNDVETAVSVQAIQSLAVKGTDVHLLYADDATQDIFHDADVDGGGTTDVERNDAVTANRLSCEYLSSSDVLAWLYLDGTTTVYDEFSLAAAPTGLPVGSLSLLGVGI